MIKTRRSEAGMTLLEVVIAVAILAVAACGTFSAVISSARMNTFAREETVAFGLAQDTLAQIRNTPFENIITTYSGSTFTVPELALPTGVAQHGEIIIIQDETPDESIYGRDIENPVGPDGVDLNDDGDRTDTHAVADPNSAFPLDLDGDGAANNDAVLAADMKVIPVIVVIRWNSPIGTGRVQMMTYIADRDG